MTEELVLHLTQETLKTTVLLASPMLVGSLVIGLAVSIFQAVTQINESTLTFIPKMAVVAVLFVLTAPWMMDVIQHFTIDLFENISTYVR